MLISLIQNCKYTLLTECQAFEHQSAQHLTYHLDGNFHTGMEKFKRAAEIRQADDPDDLYLCIYCEEAAQDRLQHYAHLGLSPPDTSFETVADLVKHIRASSVQTDGEKHDELKEMGGWYEEEFYPHVTEQTKIKASQLGAKNLKKLGVNVTKQPAATGLEPAPSHPGVVRGAQPKTEIPSRFAGSVQASALSAVPQIPPKFTGAVQHNDTQSSSTIPGFFQSSNMAGPRAVNLPSSSAPTHRPTAFVTPAKKPGASATEPMNIDSAEEESSDENENEDDDENMDI